MKKLLVLLLALVLSVGSFAVTAGAEGERVPISILSFDYGRIAIENDPIIEKIGQITGTDISVTIVPTDQFLQKVNLMMAANELPDIIRFQGYDHFQYIDSGFLLDITDYLNDYPDLYAAMPKEAWDMVTVDGRIYTVPNYNVPGKYSFYLRQDWLKNVSMEAPTNLDELRAVLNAFTFNDPDGNGKGDTYGLSTNGTITNMDVTCFMPIFGAYGVQPNRYFEKDGAVYNPVLTENYKNALAYCYELYSVDKVVDPDVFVVQGDAALQNIVNSKVGSAVGWWSLVCEVLNDQQKMKEIQPNAEWVVVNDLKGPEGDYGMLGNNLNTFTVSIASTTKNVEKCLELLNYLGSDEGFMLSCYGEQGIHYTVDEIGNFLARTEEGTTAMNDKWLDTLSQYVYRVMEYQEILCTINPHYRQYQQAAMNSKLYQNIFEGITTEASTMYLSDVNQILLDWSVRFITGKESLDNFDMFVQEYKVSGGDEIMESYLRVYNERKGTNLVAGN